MLLERAARQVGNLPPLPDAATRALGLINNPRSSMADLAEVIHLDPALTGMVLRCANSAYFAPVSAITTVQQAVAYLGHITVRNLVVSASSQSLLSRALPGYGLRRHDLWKHSLAVATGAHIFARAHGPALADSAYHAGLLHDIGKFALDAFWQQRPEQVPFVTPTLETERALLGIDHAEVGAEIARRWNLPAGLAEGIAFHHEPQRASAPWQALTDAVHLANAASKLLGRKKGTAYAEPRALARAGCTETDLRRTAERIGLMLAAAEEWLKESGR